MMINLDNIVEITVYKETKSTKVKFFKNYKLFGFIPVNGVYWCDKSGRPIISFGKEANTIEEFLKENTDYCEVNGEIWEKACIYISDVNDNEYIFSYDSYENAKQRFDSILGLYNSGKVKIFKL